MLAVSTEPDTPMWTQYAQRDGTCPSCGMPSVDYQWFGRSWKRQLCDVCLQEEKVRSDTAQDAAQRATMLHLLDVPALYRDVSVDTFQVLGPAHGAADRVVQLVRRYIGTWPDVPNVVVMQGGPGTGKGHMAWSIAKAVAGEYGHKARVVKLSDAIRDLRDAWNGGQSEIVRLGYYRAPALLVVDEVSRHAFYGQPQQHLYDLIDWREEHQRPTILTTNETPASLSALLGPALASRVMGAGSVWHFGDADYRVHRGKTRKEMQ